MELKIARIRAGYKQKTLAEKLGISVAYLQRMEYNTSRVPPKLRPKLQDLLGNYYNPALVDAEFFKKRRESLVSPVVKKLYPDD